MAVASVAATELTGITAGSFQDVDLDSFVTVPAGATGANIIVHNPSASDYSSDVRANGSTDSQAVTHTAGSWKVYAVALDANHIVEVNISNTALKVYVRDFFGSESVFFTNGVSKSPASSGSYLDQDISSDTGADTAIGAYLKLHSVGGARNAHVRKNGSTDSRLTSCDNVLAITGVDASEIFEIQVNDTDMDCYLMGYCKSGATFNTNAVDKSTATTGSYVTADTLDTGKSHGAYEFYNSAAGVDSWLRKNGATDDIYDAPGPQHAWNIVEGDASRVVSGKISAATADWYQVAQFDAAGGGPTLISASDTLALGVTDAVGSIAATLAVSDSLDVRVTDTQSLLAALSAADTVAPGVSDSAAIAVVIAASDTLAPGISDAVADMTALVSVADTLSPAIADALGQIAAALAVTDAVDVRITDAQSLLALLATADTLAPALADSATVLVAVSSGDTVTVSIADAAAVDILASTLGRMAALITVRPALAAAVATDPALGGAPGGAPALGGKPKLN